MNTIDQLSQFIEERTAEEWASDRRPYFLSNIAPELKLKNVNYRDLISPQTLKQFVATMGDKVELVQHPFQKPKIGLIPKGETFRFVEETNGQSQPDKSQTPRSHHPKYAVLNFLEALSRLDEKEIEKVDIPLSILVRLIGGK